MSSNNLNHVEVSAAGHSLLSKGPSNKTHLQNAKSNLLKTLCQQKVLPKEPATSFLYRGLLDRTGLPVARGTRLPSLRSPRDLTLGGTSARDRFPSGSPGLTEEVHSSRDVIQEETTTNTGGFPFKRPALPEELHKSARRANHIESTPIISLKDLNPENLPPGRNGELQFKGCDREITSSDSGKGFDQLKTLPHVHSLQHSTIKIETNSSIQELEMKPKDLFTGLQSNDSGAVLTDVEMPYAPILVPEEYILPVEQKVLNRDSAIDKDDLFLFEEQPEVESTKIKSEPLDISFERAHSAQAMLGLEYGNNEENSGVHSVDKTISTVGGTITPLDLPIEGPAVSETLGVTENIFDVTGSSLRSRGQYWCQICQKNYSTSQNLKTHIRFHSVGNPVQCQLCQNWFPDTFTLKYHVKRIHSEVKRYCCEICKRTFPKKHNLKLHFTLHTGEKPYECEICQFKTRLAGCLKIHYLTHTGEKPFQCSVCLASFGQKRTLDVHNFIHSGVKPFSCKFCSKVYRHAANLNRHKLTHTGEKPYRCNICQEAFTTSRAFKIHKLIHSREHPFKCKLCQKNFTTDAGLKKHTLAHTRDPETFKCESCGKIFSRACSLQVHIKSRTCENGPHVCKVCGKIFLLQWKLKAHLISAHPVVKPKYNCKFCAEDFITKYRLNSHVKRYHYKITPLQCEVCNKPFFRESDLKEHMFMFNDENHVNARKSIRTHSEPVKKIIKKNCKFCEQSFDSRYYLRCHYKYHHTEKFQFECKVCNKAFIKESNLKGHLVLFSDEESHIKAQKVEPPMNISV